MAERTKGIALSIPSAEERETGSPKLPPRLRRRLMISKSPITAQHIQAKLTQAHLRRQQFYEVLSRKARPRSRGSTSLDEDLGKRLEAKLKAAEQKRLSILEKAQTRLARLDELRQAAKTEVEARFEKERDELGAKVKLRSEQAEANRMRLLKACSQQREARRERATQSLTQRMIKESKYRESIRAAICQKRSAAERKRSLLLEEGKGRACARILQVQRVVKSVHGEKEIGRTRLKDKLEYRLQRAKNQRAVYLKQRRSLQHSVQTNSVMTQEQEQLSNVARCWRQFVHLRKTTFALAKAFEALAISEESVKSMSFERLALQIASATTIRTAKALLERLESRHLISQASTGSLASLEKIDHLLQCVASPIRRENTNTKKKVSKHIRSSKEAPLSSVALSRYPVRVFLCAYMILGHPDAVFNGRRDCENDLAQSATDLVREFELLLKIIIHGSIETAQKETASLKPTRITFRSQLESFDKAWHSYLLHFVAWKDSDAKLLEQDLVRAACQLELSMQTCKMTPELDMKAVQKKITENQKLLREGLQQLSGHPGLENLETALSEVRSRYVGSKDTACSYSSEPDSLGGSVISVSPEASDRTDTSQSSSQRIHLVFDKDASDLGKEVGSSSSFRSGADGHLSPPALVVGENELLVNEILHEDHLGFADSLTVNNDAQNFLKENVREIMEKAFWDGVMVSMKENESDFRWILKLVREVRDELFHISPQSWKQEIMDSIDIEILEQMLRPGNLDVDYFGKVLEFALVTLRKLSAPAKEDDMKITHYKFLKELGEILQAEDESKASRALAITKGLRFVLQQIQTLKMEISKARLRMVEPLIKGTAGLAYLRKAFSNRHGSPTLTPTSLPITRQWFSSVKMVAEQEWHEYKDSLSAVTNNGLSSGVPPTTLRTGGNIFVGTKISPETSATNIIDTHSPGKQLPECTGEEIDLLIRLGLLKLVSEVGGLSLEVLPEPFKINLPRLRVVQSQLQKIIVISTCLLVLRQTLLNENLVNGPLDMEKISSRCVKPLSNLLDTVEDVGTPEIIETIVQYTEDNDHLSCQEKLEAHKQIMARMLGKSLQPGDAIFKRVSRAVYLAARGVVFGGNGVHGRELAEASLRPVGAVLLADNLLKAAEVLVMVAVVSCNIHRPWYEELLKTL